MIGKDRINMAKNVDLVILCERLGISLRKNGKGYMACCPFHNEKNPSFAINTQKNLWHCFGCGKGGDTISLYMKLTNKNFKQTIEELERL